jgi:hypothetical protein
MAAATRPAAVAAARPAAASAAALTGEPPEAVRDTGRDAQDKPDHPAGVRRNGDSAMQPGDGGTPPWDPNQQPNQADPTAPAEGGPASGESATRQYPVPPQGSQPYPGAPGYPQAPQPDPGQYWSQPDQGQQQYGQAQYAQYAQPPYPPDQYGQYPYAQAPYGQPPYGQPPYGPGGYGAPPPPKNNTTKILIAAGAALVVIIAAVVVLLATRDTNKQTAGNGGSTATTSTGTPTSPSGQTTTTTTTNTDTSSTGTNPAGSSCEPGKKADLAAIDLTVVLGFIQPGSEPSGYFLNVINACTAPDLVPQLKPLYGKQFGIPEGDDKTGGNGEGPTAEYVFKDRDGKTLDLTMTKASDGHYQATKLTYDG